MKRTVCVDLRTGRTLATYPDLMKLVQVGNDFYIGQERHTVVDIKPRHDADEMIVVLTKPTNATNATP